MKKLLIGMVIVGIVGAGGFMLARSRANGKDVQHTMVEAVVGNLTEKALAVGKIDPDHEIVVKSQVSGIVETIYHEVGESVVQGEPLMVVKPEPTPIELAEARRQFELAEMNRAYLANETERVKALHDGNFVSGKDYDESLRNLHEAEIRVQQAKERLELMEKGSSQIGDRLVESVIRAPTGGTILQLAVNVGDPVVPLTSYQPGTELMRMARMDDLIFIGTVDEIDVGTISEGLPADILIGALPGEKLAGELYFISPKSRIKDNAVVFDIKIRITDDRGLKLRAGYSASAEIIVEEKSDVLTIPERLVTFQGDSTFVKVLDAVADTLVQRQVTLGFSDGLSVEVLDGLAAGEKIAEN